MFLGHILINDKTEHTELDIKCVHHVLHDIKEGAGELKTLGLTEDAYELLRTPENEQGKAAHERHIKHCKSYVDVGPDRIIN